MSTSRVITLTGRRVRVELHGDDVTATILPGDRPQDLGEQFREYHGAHPQVLDAFIEVALRERWSIRKLSGRRFQPKASALAVVKLLREEGRAPGIRDSFAAMYGRMAEIKCATLWGTFEKRKRCCLSDQDLQHLLSETEN
jgi:hypothetical protein